MNASVPKKPVPLTLSAFIKQMTMFYIDHELEDEVNALVEKEVCSRKAEMAGIGTHDGFRAFVRRTPNAIEKILSLLSFSEERFKRIVTMLRLQKGFMPTTEWSLSKVRSMMLENPMWMDEITGLLSQGAILPEYTELIPPFYRSNLLIDETTISRLASEDDIRRSAKKSFEGMYNNRLGDSFFAYIEKSVKKVCGQIGVVCESKCQVPSLGLGEVAGIAIPNSQCPRILIDVTYGITTSSAQTKYAERAERISKRLRELSVGKSEDERMIYINVVDGAGWVARQADLAKLLRASDYLLNIKTIQFLSDIIQFHFKKG